MTDGPDEVPEFVAVGTYRAQAPVEVVDAGGFGWYADKLPGSAYLRAGKPGGFSAQARSTRTATRPAISRCA
ncbi:hypothetical protein [Embleya sp. NPDC020630]|uniref:hypothetical protein n=1 Tax=Embleya sp. NPDC020630 TaxID=3363979 RepID=UPI0037B13904